MEKDRALTIVKGSSVAVSLYVFDGWFVCQDPTVRIAFDLLPKEALDYIRYKALTIAGVESGQLILEVKTRLLRAVREGVIFSDFKQEVDSIFDSYGVTKLQPNHLQTVFRTNLFSAYAAGELEQAMSMPDRFPMWRYSAILDSRTRPSHRALNGNVYRVGEGPIPPIDYNCRCTAIYLHVSQTDRLKPQKWGGDPTVQRFHTRHSFEEWKRASQQALTPDVSTWINQQLRQTGSKF